MPYTIPNEADAFNADQAEIDKIDLDILVAGLQGDGVLNTGNKCAVTAQGSPDMTLAVASGTVRIGGVKAAVTSGNVTITAAHSTNPRIDLVVVNNSGTKSVTAGTASANPVMPAIPANSVVLAAVYVPATDTAIAINQITDKRVLLPLVKKAIWGELTGLGQGDPMLYLPAMWTQNQDIEFKEIVIHALTTPSNQHSFSFFKDGVLLAAVTVTTSGKWWRTSVSFTLTGQTNYVTVRHDTNAQDVDEMSGAHVNEGTRIFAGLIPLGDD